MSEAGDERREREAESRKTRILSVAARLVVHYGPHKTTVTDIAREAGVSVGAVYLEFPSKDDIVFALAEARYTRILAAMEAALFPRGSRKSLEARIQQAFAARLELFLDTCAEGTHGLDLIACTSSPVKTAEQRFAEREQELLERGLREGAQDAAIPLLDPALTARALLRCYATFRPPFLCAQAAARPEDREALFAALNEVHRVVAHGFAGKPSGRRRASGGATRTSRPPSSQR
jgi:AcrR family transcriptional regulator